MNKYISFLVAVMALALIGCSQKPILEEDLQEITLEAVMAENNPTKTVIENGTTSILWEPGDEVKVFYNGVGSRFTSTNAESVGVAQFTGVLSTIIGFNEGFPNDTPLWGLYPYRADATSDNTSVTTTLPAQQVGRAGSFAKGTFITLGKSQSLSMGFYNVCGGIRFSLTQEGVKEVVFQGQNDEDIAGRVKLAFVDGVPAVQEVTEGQKIITLTAPNSGTFQTGQWYYIVAIPGTLSNGFKMTFNTDTQYATLKSSGAKTIKRGIFGSLADADEDLVYKDKGGSEPDPNDVIQFKDPIAKYACVEKFDTNKDGEVSYEEAAAVTSLSGLFTDWNTVTEFDEIRFFTSVTSTQSVFNGLRQLAHITIPDNITTLGTFQECFALETVVLPATLSAIPENCFENCSSLKTVTLPTGITSIPNYAFRKCVALETLELPSTIVSIGDYAFNYCEAITSVDFPASLTSIGEEAYSFTSLTSVTIGSGVSLGDGAFYACQVLESAIIENGASVGPSAFNSCFSLATLVLPDDLTSIPGGCFCYCNKLANITWPTALTHIGDSAFRGCSFKDNDYSLQLPSSVTSIGRNAFGPLHHLVLPSTSPISIAFDSFISGCTFLYVPSGMVEMYKVRTNWSNYAERIRPMSDYPVTPFIMSVDMGLSVKWASWNVGASAQEEYGDYFAWGETEPKSSYWWSTYKWCNGDYNVLTKYCPTNNSDYWDGTGAPDSKTVLDLDDDAARANCGGTWRMPTKEEWEELISNCSWTWTTINGINGQLVTSDINGRRIFLPAAGGWGDTDLYYAGSRGYYWSSSLNADNPARAWEVSFYSGPNFGTIPGNRCAGFSVRPVCE